MHVNVNIGIGGKLFNNPKDGKTAVFYNTSVYIFIFISIVYIP